MQRFWLSKQLLKLKNKFYLVCLEMSKTSLCLLILQYRDDSLFPLKFILAIALTDLKQYRESLRILYKMKFDQEKKLS